MCIEDIDIQDIEWARVDVKPRAIFVHEKDLGKEGRYAHDILILHARGGAKFVFDPTGYQFGFGDYMHEWKDYKAKFVSKKMTVRRADEEALYKSDCDAEWLSLVQQYRAEVGLKTRDELLGGRFW